MKLGIKDIVEDKINSSDLFDTLTLESIMSNYREFAAGGKYREADAAMERLFGAAWKKHQTTVWQWYDDEEKNKSLG